MTEESSSRQQLFEGMGVALALLFAFCLVIYAVLDTWADWGPNGPVGSWAGIPIWLLCLCGWVQWVYILPCYFLMARKGQPQIAKGMVLGAALLTLGNLLVFLVYWFWPRS